TYQETAPISMRGSLQDIRSGTISNLEGTGREVQAIAEHFGGEFVLSAAATEAAFKEKAPAFDLLHLAMHGEADFENPNFGNLIFTDLDNPKEEDHRLYHYEIATMQLQAQLVVLSACETGIGRYEAGEGVFSLARSFMYAGVPSVAMSLWKVNDQSTSDLMARFYQELAAGKPKAAALQDSKAAYLEASRIRYRHPYYWAGFVLLGDSRPLKAASPLNWLWIAAVPALLLFAGVFIWVRKKQG
ncbi:MAG: CHAT domain-containing protein, partial [Phaeodactylibacter sp.]|nr:CHAT domain-containing protein [Phaeodactylibacter sp.]